MHKILYKVTISQKYRCCICRPIFWNKNKLFRWWFLWL